MSFLFGRKTISTQRPLSGSHGQTPQQMTSEINALLTQLEKLTREYLSKHSQTRVTATINEANTITRELQDYFAKNLKIKAPSSQIEEEHLVQEKHLSRIYSCVETLSLLVTGYIKIARPLENERGEMPGSLPQTKQLGLYLENFKDLKNKLSTQGVLPERSTSN